MTSCRPHSFTELAAMSEGEAYGRYRLLGRIGRGASGEVFKAKSFGVEGFEKTLDRQAPVARAGA